MPKIDRPLGIAEPDERSRRRALRIFAGIEWLAARLKVEVLGIERLPPGRALLVANHAFGWDIVFAMSAIRAKTGQQVWARLLPIPHLVRIKFIIGEPIVPLVQPSGANDDVAVRRLRREVEGALHEMFEQELAARVGLPLK